MELSALAIPMFVPEYRLGRGGFDIQLFFQLSEQRRVEGFARLDLSAGKLPLGREGPAAPLTNEDAAVLHDERGDNADRAHLAFPVVLRELALEQKAAAVHDALRRADQLPALPSEIVQGRFRKVRGDEYVVFELAHLSSLIDGSGHRGYCTTLSARFNTSRGTATPRLAGAFKLIASWHFSGWPAGSSAVWPDFGLRCLKMRSIRTAVWRHI